MLSQDEYKKRLGPYPTQDVPTWDASATQAAELQKKLGYDYSQEEAASAQRQAELDALKGDNKNSALLQAGLGMMAGTSANAFENIGKGAMQGVNFLEKARVAERVEQQAIRDGDKERQRAAQAEKMHWLGLADQKANQEAAAKYQAGLGAFQTNQAALGFTREDQRAREQFEFNKARLQIEQQRNAITAAAANARIAALAGKTVKPNIKIDQTRIEATVKRLAAAVDDVLQKGKTDALVGNPAMHALYLEYKDLTPKQREDKIQADSAEIVTRRAGAYDTTNYGPYGGIGLDYTSTE